MCVCMFCPTILHCNVRKFKGKIRRYIFILSMGIMKDVVERCSGAGLMHWSDVEDEKCGIVPERENEQPVGILSVKALDCCRVSARQDVSQLEDMGENSEAPVGEWLDELELRVEEMKVHPNKEGDEEGSGSALGCSAMLEENQESYTPVAVNPVHSRSRRSYRARFTFADGDVYDGEWRSDEPHGLGSYTAVSGEKYEGYFVRGERCGRGRCLFEDGSTYEGEWKGDLPHGRGIRRYADGMVYSGSWRKGERSGQGKCVYVDGTWYEGVWCRNHRHGVGQLCNSSGDVLYSGEWRHDSKWPVQRPCEQGGAVKISPSRGWSCTPKINECLEVETVNHKTDPPIILPVQGVSVGESCSDSRHVHPATLPWGVIKCVWLILGAFLILLASGLYIIDFPTQTCISSTSPWMHLLSCLGFSNSTGWLSE